jgi:hypothetical protein
MTEEEWLESEIPQAMLRVVTPVTSPRKLRLFACACCRRVWHLLRDQRSRQAVEVAERYASGLAGEDELIIARSEALAALRDVRALGNDPSTWGAEPAAGAAVKTVDPLADHAALVTARSAEWAAIWAADAAGAAARIRAGQVERAVQCASLRCIAGNPFRPLPPRSFPLHVVGLVETIALGDLDALPFLADALADLGEEHAAAHCREPLHTPGCHVVDWILDRE